MKAYIIPISAVFLVACGSPDWSGTFVGRLTASGACSDGSTVPATDNAVQLTLRDDGDTVSWSAACGATAIADVDEERAEVRQYSCPAEILSDGTTRNTTISGGTLELDGDTLRMDVDSVVSLSGTLTATCNVALKGSLSRLAE